MARVAFDPPRKKTDLLLPDRIISNNKTRGDGVDDDGVDDGEVDNDEVDDDGVDNDGVGNDETGVQDEESLRETVIRELREVEKNTEPGFYSLIRVLYHAVSSSLLCIHCGVEVVLSRLERG